MVWCRLHKYLEHYDLYPRFGLQAVGDCHMYMSSACALQGGNPLGSWVVATYSCHIEHAIQTVTLH